VIKKMFFLMLLVVDMYVRLMSSMVIAFFPQNTLTLCDKTLLYDLLNTLFVANRIFNSF
jgi:hypothetical protein